MLSHNITYIFKFIKINVYLTTNYILSTGSSDSLLLNDLPYDFDDCSDDNNVCMDLTVFRRYSPMEKIPVAREEMSTSDVNIVRGDKTVPKESNFFNKLCVMYRYIQCHNYVTKKYDNKSGILVIFITLSVSIILSPPSLISINRRV